MNPVTAFLTFVVMAAGIAVGQWANPYLALPLFAVAAIIAMSLAMASEREDSPT